MPTNFSKIVSGFAPRLRSNSRFIAVAVDHNTVQAGGPTLPASSRHGGRRNSCSRQILRSTLIFCNSHPPVIHRGPAHIRKMSSDDAYSSFLDQANQETGAEKVSARSNTASTRAVNTDIPVGLQDVEQYYISDADEPFEPVSLKWDGRNMPSESTSPGAHYGEGICVLI